MQGISFEVVPSGTVVGKDAHGKEMVVTDQGVVFKGSRAWVTQKVWDALRDASTPAQKGGE